MQVIDKEYAGKIKEMEDMFKGAKMTNMKGERISPNVDFNSLYAFLWYTRMDVCKRVLFHRVFKNTMGDKP